MIKSKAHWDWESGYGNMEVPIVIPKPVTSYKKDCNSYNRNNYSNNLDHKNRLTNL